VQGVVWDLISLATWLHVASCAIDRFSSHLRVLLVTRANQMRSFLDCEYPKRPIA